MAGTGAQALAEEDASIANTKARTDWRPMNVSFIHLSAHPATLPRTPSLWAVSGAAVMVAKIATGGTGPFCFRWPLFESVSDLFNC